MESNQAILGYRFKYLRTRNNCLSAKKSKKAAKTVNVKMTFTIFA